MRCDRRKEQVAKVPVAISLFPRLGFLGARSIVLYEFCLQLFNDTHDRCKFLVSAITCTADTLCYFAIR